MEKTSKEKVLTDKQLKSKVKWIRFFMSVYNLVSLKKMKRLFGKEIFLTTDEGKVRVLTYNMDNPQRLPLFVNIHGGGFVLGNPEMDDPFMPNIANKANVKIISIDYSLAPEFPFPKALNECFAVVKYAKEHPDEFGIDPDKIAVGGQSAGGNISAGICLIDKNKMETSNNLSRHADAESSLTFSISPCIQGIADQVRNDECVENSDIINPYKTLGIKCLILDYPPLDVYTEAGLKPQPKGSLPIFMCRLFDACYCNNKEARKNPLMSPVFATIDDLRSFPPTLVISASRDSLFEEDEKFRDKLLEAGVEVTHKRFDDVHGFNLAPGANSDESWQMIIDHLRRYLWGNGVISF
jgi:acetyl esterase